ncbi:adenylate/guanylate cyclase domain-containing protein [Chondromyces crocatus]|uniref:Guanylate cyclase domain-containing protein n=1 Tax=Chondromyces crocatus TaxID=52 RepID=A0A0K1EQ41_CHOCO|nr:adenylate/guanylate cyclase domain-containing protein [Chondromyces crocatus]AKT42934.1 uncharacterized protein CMC5_071620 [Chondromyces crocatus]
MTEGGRGVVVVERRVACRHPPERLWPLVTDTERLNRAAGLASLTLEAISGPTAARYRAITRIGVFHVAFEERPFEWIHPRMFRVLRRFREGPASSIETHFQLDPTATGTTLTLRVMVTSRVPLLAPLLRLQAWHVTGRITSEILRLDAHLDDAAVNGSTPGIASQTPPPIPHSKAGAAPPHPSSHGATLDLEALARTTSALRATHPDVAERLTTFVREADDVTVSRIRPFALADAWHLDRSDVLRACLQAVRAGLLELRWEILCPSCRLPASTVPTLADLQDHGHCQLCDLELAVDLDEAVEATFSPAPAVRRVDMGAYCIGGPARTPHVLSQTILPPEGLGRLHVPALENVSSAPHRLFVRGGASVPVDITPDGGNEVRVDAASPAAAGPVRIAPRGMILLDNRQPLELHAKLERLTFPEQGASARIVTAIPEFRRDFSRDMLRPGVALRVSRVTLFFSDLTDSTLLYSSLGDAAAFKLVQDHFDLVLPILAQHGGSVVKTIGDAVMATFIDELEGLKASLSVLQAFDAFRTSSPEAARTHIKLGLHTGTVYAITANGMLDYFGQTVNIAARMQAQAASGELVVGAPLAERADDAGLLSSDWTKEAFLVPLKGVDQSLPMARVRRRRSNQETR